MCVSLNFESDTVGEVRSKIVSSANVDYAEEIIARLVLNH